MKCSALTFSLLLCSSISYGDTGHDIRDHSDLMEDAFCVAMYAEAAAISISGKADARIALDLETRGRGLAIDMLRKAEADGHTFIQVAEMLAEVTLKMGHFQLDDKLRFAEYIDCAGRTKEYVLIFK